MIARPARRGTKRGACLLAVRVFLAILLLASPAVAQEYVSVRGTLADDAFYQVVACAASPGAACRKPFLRWSPAKRAALTVSLGTGTLRLAAAQRVPYEAALDAALAEVNALGADIRLRRVAGPADIAVHVVATHPGRTMRDTGVPGLDGVVLPLARVSVSARAGEIRAAQIAVSAHARRAEIPSLLLEEIVQALGLITDIRGGAYGGSIFAEDSNSVTTLRSQDAMALRRHYPRTILVAAGG